MSFECPVNVKKLLLGRIKCLIDSEKIAVAHRFDWSLGAEVGDPKVIAKFRLLRDESSAVLSHQLLNVRSCTSLGC
jgi:hypothetical protein